MFSTNIILDNAIRWALVGAAVGGVGGVVKGFSAKRSAAAAETTKRKALSSSGSSDGSSSSDGEGGSAEVSAKLALDASISAAVQALDEFRSHAPAAHTELMRCGGELAELQIRLHQMARPPFALSTKASKHCAGMIEAVRELRARLVDTRPAVQTLEQFDDAAGAVQKLCNDAMHNITLTIQSKK